MTLRDPELPSAHLVALFPSVHHVLAAERAFQKTGLWCDVVPTPRELSSDCGVALRFRSSESEAARALLLRIPNPAVAVYREVPDGYEPATPDRPPEPSG